MDKLLGLGVDLVKELLDRGETLTLDQVRELAVRIAKEEVAAVVFAQVLGMLHSEAQAVRAAFNAKPGEVPVLELGEAEYVKP